MEQVEGCYGCRMLARRAADAQATIAALQAVIDDHHRLVREMDVRLNGEQGAAKQASLCDIVSQLVALQARVQELELALSQKTMRVLDLIAANERLTHEIVGLRYAKQ